MKFKLNNSEMLALIMVFQNCIQQINNWQSKKAEDLLLLAVLEEMNLKMHQQILLKKPKYNVKLQPIHAIAFFIMFNQKLNATTHAGNMVQTMCNAIHQQILSK